MAPRRLERHGNAVFFKQLRLLPFSGDGKQSAYWSLAGRVCAHDTGRHLGIRPRVHASQSGNGVRIPGTSISRLRPDTGKWLVRAVAYWLDGIGNLCRLSGCVECDGSSANSGDYRSRSRFGRIHDAGRPASSHVDRRDSVLCFCHHDPCHNGTDSGAERLWHQRDPADVLRRTSAVDRRLLPIYDAALRELDYSGRHLSGRIIGLWSRSGCCSALSVRAIRATVTIRSCCESGRDVGCHTGTVNDRCRTLCVLHSSSRRTGRWNTRRNTGQRFHSGGSSHAGVCESPLSTGFGGVVSGGIDGRNHVEHRFRSPFRDDRAGCRFPRSTFSPVAAKR